MSFKSQKQKGFTLIELMIVMSIVALLMAMVGPLAINSLEKARAKQEMLTLKNWLRKVSNRAFTTGKAHTIVLDGKSITLFANNIFQVVEATPVTEGYQFESLFFQPQQLHYSSKGFVSPEFIIATYRGKALTLNLTEWVNGKKLENNIER